MRDESCINEVLSQDCLETLSFWKTFMYILVFSTILRLCEALGRSLRNCSTIAPNKTNRSSGAKDVCATRRTLQKNSNKAGARGIMRVAFEPQNGLRDGVRGGGRESSTVCKEIVPSCAGEPFLHNTTRQLGALLDCFVASRSPDERSFDVLKFIGVYGMEVRSWSTNDESQVEEGREGDEKSRREDSCFVLVHR